MLGQAAQQEVGQGWSQVASVPPTSDLPFWRLLEKLPAGAYTCNAEGLITYFNQHAVQLWGRAPQLHDPEDRFCGSFKLFASDGTPIAHDQCWMALALKTGKAYDGHEIIIERPDGQRLTVLAHANPISDGFGNLLGAVNGNEVKRQQAMTRQGGDFRAEFRILHPDGRVRWLAGQGSMICDAAGQPHRVIGINYDITARKQVEDARSTLNTLLEQRVAERTAALEQAHEALRHEMTERQRMQEALFQREKLAALGTLLANVAHELNNPLAVAAMQLDNLQEEWGPGSWTEDLETLQQAVERCKSVVQSFLALARQQAPTRDAVALNAVIGDVLVLLGHALAVDGITVHLHLAQDRPKLWADPHQLHHVVSNLITNAHHALRQIAPPQHLRLITVANTDQSRVTLEVADTGPGIPQELQRRIFEPFFTTKPQDMGSGLGLPLCRNIVEAHGGSIRMVSQPGHGTTFYVTLPVAAPDMQAVETAPEPAEVVQGQHGTILLIDDEPWIAQALTRLLQRSGYDITRAANGLEGLCALEARSYDVILCDMRMPDLDGPGFYREVGRRHPHLLPRIIFLTGDVLSPESHAFFDRVKSSYLTKPFKVAEVRRAIRQVLETR